MVRRLNTCVDAPLLGRLEEDERVAMERKPILAVEAALVVVWCWVCLEAAWMASLRRTLADAMVLSLILGFGLSGVGFGGWRAFSVFLPLSHASVSPTPKHQ